MEQPSRRNKFIKTSFNKVYKDMYLSDKMLEEMFDDYNNPCKELMAALRELANIDAQKCFILLKFTDEREPVKYLAKLLRKYNQAHVAEALEKFNSSEELIPYERTEFLPVRHTDVLRSGGSCYFIMETSPRGLCLIIVNEVQLEAEAKQLASIFSQMYFTVRVEKNKTSIEINELFDELANNSKFQGYNALVTILIGHGGDGLFCGSHIDWNPRDNVPIPHLIDWFSENKSLNFKNKPKINVFNCCRDRTCDKMLDLSQVSSTLLNRITVFNKDWVNTNVNTTVIYSCAEGQESFFSKLTGFTFFGRALSHTLAQYACEKSLDQLIKIVNKRLENDDIKQFPEVIHYKSIWSLYFNPGRIRID